MKSLKFGLCAIVLVVCGAFAVEANPLVGAKKCTWGPSYWCSNFATSKECRATNHCIQTVWEKQDVAVDNDSICKICKDMVTQARDQLRSNETMEELKEVFEGSCKLIPIKVVNKECCKLADDFIPELVEALSSQMNPDQVCSVAGLCNNAEIDKLLMQYFSAALDGTLADKSEEVQTEKAVEPKHEAAVEVTPAPKKHLLSCGNCNHVANIITEKFNYANRDELLENILHLCGEMSSFSDACSNIVLTYFNDIYQHFKEHLNADGLCHMSGACSSMYHQHPEDPKEEVDAEALASVAGDDIPCELCQQLVHHLRDLLVANTTEVEFKQVLEGLCKQTRSFKDECLSIADQYYDVIYKSLVNNLDANGACFLIGVCPKGKETRFQGPVMPLLPVFPPAKIEVTIHKKLGASEPKFTQEELHSMTLPIDRLMGAANPQLLVEGGELCTLCEYMLHFIQDALAEPKTDDEIKNVVSTVCNRMPTSLRGQCHNFIDMYGDAVIALLIQGLNPREVCPKMQMCPPNHDNHDDMEVFSPAPVDESDKPTCPLCLFAVEQAQQKIKDDKTKKNIKNVLDHLCVHLPNKLQKECVDFIETYSNELIDMLITDFKPQEICVQLHLCPSTNTYLSDLGISVEEGSSEEIDSAFNEIEDSDERPTEIEFSKVESPNCILCEEFIKIAEKKIGKKASKEEIKKALEHSCDKLHSKKAASKCHHIVAEYGDKIANLIMQQMEPKLICRELGMCLWSEQEDLEIDEALKYDVIAMPNSRVSLMKNDRFTGADDIMAEPPTCVLCEFVMTKLEADLKNKTEQEEIKRAIENICHHMPKTVSHSCTKFVDQYANAIIALIGSVPPKEICLKLQLCFAGLDDVVSDEVVECGVCHGATLALLPYLKQHLDHSAITVNEMTLTACENLPPKYYQVCSEMISIYGQSIMHLSDKPSIDNSNICAEIGKCFESEKSGLAFARISA